jgi:hypothetical protein
MTNEARYHELQDLVSTLTTSDPRFRAFGSAVDNASDTVAEGTIKHASPEWFELFMSSYASSLEDN